MGSIVDLSVGIERGNTLMFGFTLHSPLDKLYMPKLNDPPRVPVAAGRSQRTVNWAETSRDIQAQSDWHVREIRQSDHDLDVVVDDAAAIYMRERVDRIASVLHRDAPPSVDRFNLTYRQNGIEVAEHSIDRDAWVEEKTQILPPRRQRDPILARPAALESVATPAYSDILPRFESGLGTNFQQTLGGPDGFILYQFGVTERVKFRIRDDTWLQGYVQLGLIDNYAKFKYTAPSNLPRVRTYLREYLTSTPLTMPNLQFTHVGKWGDNQYYSLYGGYLESMFAGVGAEWLYRSFGSRTAFGIDINGVQQRDFQQDFSFESAGDQTGYRVATGHATLYWDTGWNGVQANLSAGRYLAKDVGVTVQVSKVFQNSVTVGAFFSKTNASAAQFGEGSFDKGIYVSIPFDAFLTKSSNSVGNFVWKPLTRDGGAKLARNFSLYDFTSLRDSRTLDFKLAPKPEEMSIPEERADYAPVSRSKAEPYTLVTPRVTAAQWGSDSRRYEQQVLEALQKQGFRNIQVFLDASQRLNLRLSNEQIRPVSRAVGRAARTALQLSPLDVREIRVEYLENNAPQVTYEFVDLSKLGRLLNGAISPSDLEPTVSVTYINPGARQDAPLDQLADLDTRVYERSLGDALLPTPQTSRRVTTDVLSAGRVLADSSWIKSGLLGTGLVLVSTMFDNRADRFAKDHADNRWLKGVNTFGNALPWLAVAGTLALTIDEGDPVRARTAYAGAEAGGAAFLAVTALKYVGRARPFVEVGNHAFKPFSSASGYDSMPSGHTIISWAIATPFAEEYDAPWLYGIAGVTNLARVGSRQHWVSDTVAGSLLGYAIGKTFWAAGKETAKGSPRVVFGPQSIGLAWALQ
jgi:membrane-associated phospholipid phosphatase